MVPSPHKFIDSANKELSKYKFLNQLENTTKIPKLYLVLGVACASLVLAITLLSAQFVVCLLSTIYPIYATHLAIESQDKTNLAQILAYWIIFAMITVFESVPWQPAEWIPAYQLLKAIFLFFLFTPKYNGSVVLYNKFLKSSLQKSAPCISKVFTDMKKTLEEATKACSSSEYTKGSAKTTD